MVATVGILHAKHHRTGTISEADCIRTKPVIFGLTQYTQVNTVVDPNISISNLLRQKLNWFLRFISKVTRFANLILGVKEQVQESFRLNSTLLLALSLVNLTLCLTMQEESTFLQSVVATPKKLRFGLKPISCNFLFIV